MKATSVQKFILYSLCSWIEEANKRIVDKQLQVSISKALFIEMVRNAGLAEKQKRALYKNLEALEKKRLISYNNKDLSLTSKGDSIYKKIYSDILPYFLVRDKLNGSRLTSYTKKVQTVFRH